MHYTCTFLVFHFREYFRAFNAIYQKKTCFQLSPANDTCHLTNVLSKSNTANVDFYLLQDVDHLFRVEKYQCLFDIMMTVDPAPNFSLVRSARERKSPP